MTTYYFTAMAARRKKVGVNKIIRLIIETRKYYRNPAGGSHAQLRIQVKAAQK